jgi:hypothetical protein
VAIIEVLQGRRTGLGRSAWERSRDLLIDCLGVAPCVLPLPGGGCLFQLANELIARDPDPFLDLGENLIVRWSEALSQLFLSYRGLWPALVREDDRRCSRAGNLTDQ